MSRRVVATEMISPELAPTWNPCVPALVARMDRPLNFVVVSVRSISSASAWNSWSRLARSLVPLVELADCTASSRMRCSMSPTLPIAPSAVCASEMASLELRMATFMPRTWAPIRSAMARPAASSLALLTRKPVDRRCIEVASDICEVFRFRWAFSETMLVLMIWGIEGLLKGTRRRRAPGSRPSVDWSSGLGCISSAGRKNFSP